MNEQEYLSRAQEELTKRAAERDKYLYTLKLEIEQSEQSLQTIRSHHEGAIAAASQEYEEFQQNHPAHGLVRQMTTMQNKVEDLEKTQTALLLYIKFYELRYFRHYLIILGCYLKGRWKEENTGTLLKL